MSGGVKESKLAAREARTRSVTLLRMTTALPKKEVFHVQRMCLTARDSARHKILHGV